MQCLTQSVSPLSQRKPALRLPGNPGEREAIRGKHDLRGGEEIKDRPNESQRVNTNPFSWKLSVILKSG